MHKLIDEPGRIRALRRYDVLDTLPETPYDDITRLASQICNTPIALISLIDENRQWFKSRIGIEVEETGLDISFCVHTLKSGNMMVVPDATQDPRFSSNSMVTGATHVRYYAGAPLVTPDGYNIGTLCVIDRVDRQLNENQEDALRTLSRLVVDQLELRRTNVNLLHSLDLQSELLNKHVESELAVKQSKADLQDQHNLLRSIIQSTTDGVYLTDLQGRYLLVNSAQAELVGIRPEQYLGCTDFDLFPLELAKLSREKDEYVVQSRRSVQYEYVAEINAVKRTFLITKDYCYDSYGCGLGIIGISREITDRKAAEDRLRVLESAVENANEAILITEGNKTDEPGPAMIYANKAFLTLTGWSPEEVVGKSPRMLQGPATSRKALDKVRTALEAFEPVKVELINYKKDGSPFWLELSIHPVTSEENDDRKFVAIQRDISERKQIEIERQKHAEDLDKLQTLLEVRVLKRTEELALANNELEAEIAERKILLVEREQLLQETLLRADQDPLTGLLNHRAFHSQLAIEAQKSLETGSSLGLAVIDLDNFKFFNDVYGHATGDEVLRKIAGALKQAAKPNHILGRFGGDEFAIIMPDLPSDELEAVAANLQQSIGEIGYQPPGYEAPIPMSLSIGTSLFPIETGSWLEALNLADRRLLSSKQGIGNSGLAETLRNRINKSIEGFAMLEALVVAVDNKDRYTRRHSEDVLTHCLLIAQEIGLRDEEQHDLATAALIHDVGKIGVPDFILRKPGRLTVAEFESVKQHPEMGAVMAGSVKGLEKTLAAIRHHHERWDGAGYPDKLAGDEIPYLARLMAVADAYSAMTTDRPYRKGMPQPLAIAQLRKGRGTQWDADVVDAFVRVCDRQPVVD